MATKQILIGELKVGDEFTDISNDSRTKGEKYIVSFVGSKMVDAYPTWDKNAEHYSDFLIDELVEITIGG